MLALHPEERIWLDAYRKAIAEGHPGTVLRMSSTVPRRAATRTRTATWMCFS